MLKNLEFNQSLRFNLGRSTNRLVNYFTATAQHTSLAAATEQVAQTVATSEPIVTPEATTTAVEVPTTTAVTDPTLESLATPLAVLPETSPMDKSTMALTQTDDRNNLLSAKGAAPGDGQSFLGI